MGSTAAGSASPSAGTNSASGAAGSVSGGSAAGGVSSAGAGGVSAGSAGVAGAAAGGGGTAGGAGAGGSGGSGGSGGAVAIDHNAHGLIVVLGSSTAAGTGPTDPRNAWVERYRAYLKQEFVNFELINLAVGGYTTYQVQATGYAPPQGRPAPVPDHNISKALSSTPDAIIINLPGNDTASGFTQEEQMGNFTRVTDLATASGVLCWVTTTQPRNFADMAQRTLQMSVRDAIKAKYADHTLDFWTAFAQADGKIKPMYDSGDGTHMNDAAHAILVEQVIAAKVPEAILSK